MVLSLAVFLPGWWSIPPVDRDETRFAQASKQMVATGDLIDIRFQDEPRYKKPIGIYWLQSATAALIDPDRRDEIWVYRVPSLIGAVTAVLLTARIGGILFNPPIGWLAALLLASCVLLGVEARLAKTDAVLLAAILTAQGALARLYLGAAEDRGGRMSALFWAALGGAILIKGPVAPLVLGGTIVALLIMDQRLDCLTRLRWWWGVPLCLAIIGPWLVAIAMISDGTFFSGQFAHDAFGKIVAGQESHGAPPSAYLLAFWLTFWPFSLLAGLAIPWVWRARRRPAVRFCLAWILPTWLVFELAASKLPHYVLPIYPAIALLTAAAAADGFGWRGGSRRWWRFWPVAGLWGMVSLALGLAVAGLPWIVDGAIDPLAMFGAGVALALAGTGMLALGRQEISRSIFAHGLAAMALFWTAYGRVLPHFDAIWVAPRLQQAVAQHHPCPDQPVAVAGYSEPSVVFLLGTSTLLMRGDGAAGYLLGDRCRLAVIESREEPTFHRVIADAGRDVASLASLEGFNFNGGDYLKLQLYHLSDPDRR